MKTNQKAKLHCSQFSGWPDQITVASRVFVFIHRDTLQLVRRLKDQCLP